MKFPKPMLPALFLLIPILPAFGETTVPPAGQCEEAVTVFQDVSRMGRKDRAAANMTRRHADMAEEGWRFADKEVYTENGDLEGFYLTYVRTVGCPGQAADKE